MHHVPYEPDRRAQIDLTALTHVGPPAGWAALWPHGEKTIELRIGGDEQGPYARLIELAETALPHLDEIERAADGYLREFVNYEANFYRGTWKVQSVRLSWTEGARLAMGTEFRVTLWVAEDDYGEWEVRFVRDTSPPRAFRPFAFSRTQR